MATLFTQQQATQQGKWTGGQQRIDASGIFSLFEQAITNKLKWPKVRLMTVSRAPVVLKRAGDKSKYTGQIMVTDDRPFGQNTYYGRIDLQGQFWASAPSAEVADLLVKLSADPAGVAAEYGRLTGNCCFCDLRLTDARSTAVGYGPICAEHFGLPWGE